MIREWSDNALGRVRLDRPRPMVPCHLAQEMGEFATRMTSQSKNFVIKKSWLRVFPLIMVKFSRFRGPSQIAEIV